MGVLEILILGACPIMILASPYVAHPPKALAKDDFSHGSIENTSPTATRYILPEASDHPSFQYGRPDALLELRARGCTTTIRNNNIPCYWDGTQTLYTATRTLTAPVDCHGCSDIHVQQDVYFCPVEKIHTTYLAPNPSTTWVTVCATSTQKAVKLHKRDALTANTLGPLPGRTQVSQPPPTGGVVP